LSETLLQDESHKFFDLVEFPRTPETLRAWLDQAERQQLRTLLVETGEGTALLAFARKQSAVHVYLMRTAHTSVLPETPVEPAQAARAAGQSVSLTQTPGMRALQVDRAEACLAALRAGTPCEVSQ
jgi:hypothetical protein